MFPTAQDPALIPITLGGVLIGAELVRVISLKLDLLSPRSIISIFGVYFFYLVPVLHLALDHWLSYIPSPDNWQNALGNFARYQAICIIIYLFAVSFSTPPPNKRYVNERLFSRWAKALIFLGFVAWMAVAISFGGPVGYLQSLINETAELSGYGTILILAECWPSILLALILILKRRQLETRPGLLVLLFISFVLLQFIVGGLRGSRALTVWPFLIGLIICHLVVRKISVRTLISIAVVLFGFSWVYSIYKSAAGDIVNLFTGDQTTGELADQTGRGVEMLATEDFGRAGVQTLVYSHIQSGWDWTWGETYLGDFFKFVPDQLHSFEWRDKTAVATEMFYGLPSEDLGGFKSSRILGLTGEAMVNFGLLGPIVIFVLFGLFVGKAEQYFNESKQNPEATGSALIAAVLPAISILMLISDFDNLVLFFLKYAFPLILLAWLSSRVMTKKKHLKD